MNKIREEAIFPEQSRDYTTRITFSTKRDVARVLKHALHSRLAHGPANSFRIKVLGTNELEVNMREGQITEVLEGMRSTLVNKYQIKSWTVEEEVEEVKTQDAEENTTKELSLGSDLSIHVQDLALELGLYKDEVEKITTEAEKLKSEAAILQRKMSEYETGKKGYETKLEQNKQLLRLQEEQLGVLSVENSRLVSERVPIQVLEAAKNERDYLQTQVQQLEKKVASSTEQLKRVQDDFIKRQADAYREWEITRTTDFNRIKNLEEKIAKDNKRIPAVEVTAADEIVNRELEQLRGVQEVYVEVLAILQESGRVKVDTRDNGLQVPYEKSLRKALERRESSASSAQPDKETARIRAQYFQLITLLHEAGMRVDVVTEDGATLNVAHKRTLKETLDDGNKYGALKQQYDALTAQVNSLETRLRDAEAKKAEAYRINNLNAINYSEVITTSEETIKSLKREYKLRQEKYEAIDKEDKGKKELEQSGEEKGRLQQEKAEAERKSQELQEHVRTLEAEKESLVAILGDKVELILAGHATVAERIAQLEERVNEKAGPQPVYAEKSGLGIAPLRKIDLTVNPSELSEVLDRLGREVPEISDYETRIIRAVTEINRERLHQARAWYDQNFAEGMPEEVTATLNLTLEGYIFTTEVVEGLENLGIGGENLGEIYSTLKQTRRTLEEENKILSYAQQQAQSRLHLLEVRAISGDRGEFSSIHDMAKNKLAENKKRLTDIEEVMAQIEQRESAYRNNRFNEVKIEEKIVRGAIYYRETADRYSVEIIIPVGEELCNHPLGKWIAHCVAYELRKRGNKIDHGLVDDTYCFAVDYDKTRFKEHQIQRSISDLRRDVTACAAQTDLGKLGLIINVEYVGKLGEELK